MARILSIGAALQNIFLANQGDLSFGNIGGTAQVEIDKISYGAGGSGLNAAVTLARHGHETILFSAIAKDAAGDTILRTLDKEGIDSSFLDYSSRTPTGSAIILLDTKANQQTTLTSLGAAKSFDNFDVTDIDMIQPDWLFVSSLSGDFKTIERIFKRAHDAGVKIMFKPGAKELADAKKLVNLFKYVDIISMNKQEAAKIVPGTMLAEIVSRLNNYVGIAIITDGQMGGIASNRTETYRFGVYEYVKVKDSTGAGDAFGAGFLAHFASGKSFRSSLIFASANATAVVSKIGANSGALKGNEELHPMPIQKI